MPMSSVCSDARNPRKEMDQLDWASRNLPSTLYIPPGFLLAWEAFASHPKAGHLPTPGHRPSLGSRVGFPGAGTQEAQNIHSKPGSGLFTKCLASSGRKSLPEQWFLFFVFFFSPKLFLGSWFGNSKEL